MTFVRGIATRSEFRPQVWKALVQRFRAQHLHAQAEVLRILGILCHPFFVRRREADAQLAVQQELDILAEQFLELQPALARAV
ncbi:hypothetical protein D3C86_1693780 [compost metagenome]